MDNDQQEEFTINKINGKKIEEATENEGFSTLTSLRSSKPLSVPYRSDTSPLTPNLTKARYFLILLLVTTCINLLYYSYFYRPILRSLEFFELGDSMIFFNIQQAFIIRFFPIILAFLSIVFFISYARSLTKIISKTIIFLVFIGSFSLSYCSLYIGNYLFLLDEVRHYKNNLKLDKSQETIDTDSSDVFLIWSRDYGYTSNLMKFNTGNGKTTEVTQFRDQEVKVSENNRVIVGNDHNNPRLLIYDLANQSKLELISNNLRNSPYYDSSYNDGTFSNDQEYYFDKRFEIGENLLFFHQAGLKIKINIPDKKITTDLIPYKNVSLGKRNVHQNISEEKHYKISDNYYFSRKYTIKDNGDQYFAMSQCPKEYSFSGTEPDSFEADNDPCVKSAINNVIALKKSGESNFNIIFDLATGLPEKATMDGISRSIDERVITDFRQIPFADGLFVTLVNKIKSTPEEIKEKKDEESNGVYYSGETLYYQYTHTVLYVSENDVKKVNDFVTVINEKDGNEYYGENFFPYK